MKKVFLSLFAIAIAVAGVAFTTTNKTVDTYWFQYNAAGTAIVPVDVPNTPPTSNPFICPTGTKNCASEFEGYKVDPNDATKIIPDGTLYTTLTKN